MGKGQKKGIHCSQMTEQRSSSIFKFSTEPNPVADTSYIHQISPWRITMHYPNNTSLLEAIQCLSLLDWHSTYLPQ